MQAQQDVDWQRVAIWVGVLLTLILVLALAVHFLRARARRRDDRTGGPVFTLQDLRDMRDRGDLTVAEFDHLRETMIRQAQRTMEKDPDAPPP
jgi:hypothetical protein